MPDVSRSPAGPTAFLRRVLHQLGRRRRDRKSQELCPSGEEQNNTRRECVCLPKLDTRSLTRRNCLVKAKSEEQTTVKHRLLVRASSEDHSRRPPTRSRSPPPAPPPTKNKLTRAKSEEQQRLATKSLLVRANSDGRRYKVSNLLSERQKAVASQDTLHCGQ